MAVLLEQSVDARDAAVPGVLQVLQRQPAVLGIGLLPLQTVLRPHTLAVNELTFPWLDVPAYTEGGGEGEEGGREGGVGEERERWQRFYR